MADIKCNACEELRTKAPEFATNGVTDAVCLSLKNNTGFSTSNDNDDCEDLNNANDCLVGAMENEVRSYQMCDWRAFMMRFISNLHSVLKAMICAICGLFTKVEKAQCEINYLFIGDTFAIGESVSGNSYAVAGKGVSFLIPKDAQQHTQDLGIEYIAGGLCHGIGSFCFFKNDFEDDANCMCFDTNVNGAMSQNKERKGNSVWDDTGRPASGGELICEFRMKNSAYPQVKNFYRGFGQETGGGAYHVDFKIFTQGTWAWGQHGWCDDDGEPSASGYSHGHQVPNGWTYLQVRLTYAIMKMTLKEGQQLTPQYMFGIRMDQNKIDCKEG